MNAGVHRKAVRYGLDLTLSTNLIANFLHSLMQGLATVMSKAGEGTEMLEMLRRAVQTAMEAGKTKQAMNLRMLLGQMYTLEVSPFSCQV